MTFCFDCDNTSFFLLDEIGFKCEECGEYLWKYGSLNSKEISNLPNLFFFKDSVIVDNLNEEIEHLLLHCNGKSKIHGYWTAYQFYNQIEPSYKKKISPHLVQMIKETTYI